jgi:methylenetetrahydrofolate reductase (NADPH)
VTTRAAGDHPQAKGVFDLDSTQLIEIARGMNEGRDMLGREMAGGPASTSARRRSPRPSRSTSSRCERIRKIEAGADASSRRRRSWTSSASPRPPRTWRPHGVKVIAGSCCSRARASSTSSTSASRGSWSPTSWPAHQGRERPVRAESVALATEQVRALREIADGVHIMPLGADDAVVRILEDSGLT